MEPTEPSNAGDPRYRAYVGPPGEYDLMGATQFRLLTSLGLREHHRLLDLGCGSLRAGRLLIPFLDPGHYFGIEPNAWLIEQGLENEVGRELLKIKSPRFDYNDQFDCKVFGESFDFIIAQSIFSHTAAGLFITGLKKALSALSPTGLVLATFVPPGRARKGVPGWDHQGWIYPSVSVYTTEELDRVFDAAGAKARLLPWRHPRQIWFAAANTEGALPPACLDRELTGFTWRAPGYS